ncbi:hypothetical protein [Bacillus sp. FJAT-26390]|uniref:hypothetical protein n=1 Tax=Bacillus sp. FJAT-26390 TaxID=1743142 RepID=UPI0020FFFEA1|nr:hypothetical protein [Bacillus sp. FJAT-26390]
MPAGVTSTNSGSAPISSSRSAAPAPAAACQAANRRSDAASSLVSLSFGQAARTAVRPSPPSATSASPISRPSVYSADIAVRTTRRSAGSSGQPPVSPASSGLLGMIFPMASMRCISTGSK